MDLSDSNTELDEESDLKVASSESTIGKETTDTNSESKIKRKRSYIFRCTYPDCDKIFPRKYRLQRHQRMHTSEKPFICSVDGCDKSFTCINYLKRHMKRPHGESTIVTRFPKVHECKDCGKTFKHKFDLKTHSGIHGGEKPFKCNHCDAAFALKARLKKHMKRHDGYPCKEESCDFVAESWSAMLKHRTHDHQKLSQCDVCDHVFRTKTNLHSHLRIHFENEFQCSYDSCDRNFQKLSNLQSHIEAVHNRKVYKCQFEGCDSEFHYKASQLRHQKMHSQPSTSKKATANLGRTKCMAAVLSECEITREDNYKLLRSKILEPEIAVSNGQLLQVEL